MSITTSFPAPPPEKDGWPWSGGSVCGSNGELCPKVSIVTPSFNQAAFLEETIRSVLLQGYSNLEFIVVDGGSTDDSVEVIRRYEPWIEWWVSEADRGQADAINKGFAQASGSIIGWLNSDDVLYPGFIQRRVEEFDEAPDIDLLYGDVEIGASCDAPRTVLQGRSTDFETMVRTLEVPIPQQSALWRRSLIDEIGGLDDRWRVVLDREFFLRVARHSRIAYRPGISGLFRLHPDSKSVAEELQWVDELPRMYREFFSDSELPTHIARYETEAMVAVERLCAQLLWRNKRLRAWFGCVRRAMLRDPFQFVRQFVIGLAVSKVRGAFRRGRDLFGKILVG
jgi:glycosyltransferase involved in cell wall biosynthesis